MRPFGSARIPRASSSQDAEGSRPGAEETGTLAGRGRFALCLAAACALLLASCVEEFQTTGLSGSSLGASSSQSGADETGLSKHDVALRFLTAFIRLDRNMALRYATPEAVAKFDWNAPHMGNIPYYDDKMILYFRGGWARVYFQDFGNTYKISNFDVHRR